MSKEIFVFTFLITLMSHSLSFGTGGIESNGGIGGSGETVNEGADKTASDNAMGEIMSYMMSALEIGGGTAMISEGTSSCPACNVGLIAQGSMMVGMGVMSAAQAAAHGESKDQANETGLNTDAFGSSNWGANSSYMDERNPNSLINQDRTLKAVKGNLAKLEKMGIYNPKNGTIKAGDKTFKVSDFSSTASMASAGIPKGTIDGLMSINSEMEKKAKEKLDKLKIGALTKESGFEEGGGRKVSSESLAEEDFYSSSKSKVPATNQDPLKTDPSAAAIADPFANSKYRAYLPGGDKDPSRGILGQNAWDKEVTGQGGRSNWEKIKIRYAEKINTFFND